jgi:PAS domain-containing protein
MTTNSYSAPYIEKSLDNFPCGLLSFLPDGTITAINETMAKWAGKESSELLGQNFRSLLDRPSMLYYNLVVDPLLNLKGYASEISLKFLDSEGHFDALLNVKAHKDPQGRLVIINTSVFKVFDRKKYETELLLETRKAEQQRQLAEQEKRMANFLFNSMPNHIWTTNPQGSIINMNQKAREYLGSSSPISSIAFSVVAKIDRGVAIAQWRACLSSGRKFERDLRINDTSGKQEWFSVCAEPYYNLEDQLEMWFCSATNIHKKKLLQLANQEEMRENLYNAYRNLEEKSELLVEIATTQSHMVRKPLANILGLASLMKMERDQVVAELLLEKLMESATELDEMVRQISKKTIH